MSDGGPIYPNPLPTTPEFVPGEHWYGISLRDWFAGQALAGICADTGSLERAAKEQYGKRTIRPEMVAAAAYQIADAMLKARES